MDCYLSIEYFFPVDINYYPDKSRFIRKIPPKLIVIHWMLIYSMHKSTSSYRKTGDWIVFFVFVFLFCFVLFCFFWQLMVAGAIGASGAFVQIMAYKRGPDDV